MYVRSLSAKPLQTPLRLTQLCVSIVPVTKSPGHQRNHIEWIRRASTTTATATAAILVRQRLNRPTRPARPHAALTAITTTTASTARLRHGPAAAAAAIQRAAYRIRVLRQRRVRIPHSEMDQLAAQEQGADLFARHDGIRQLTAVEESETERSEEGERPDHE